MSTICFNRALEIIGTDKIQVPGCEPTSAMSSDTLARFNECKCALVDLNKALAAIPGSTVRFGINFGDGVRQRWFVLPAECLECPCPDEPDYYQIIRDLCDEDEPEPELEDCEVWWPADTCLPDLRGVNVDDLPPDTYFTEGTNPILNNLWASSPWFIQQQNKARAAGQPAPTIPNTQQKPLPPLNKESVVLNDNQGIQSSAECASADADPGDFSGLMDLLQQ